MGFFDDPAKLKAALGAVGQGMASGNYGNVGMNMQNAMRGNVERTAATQQKQLLADQANRTATYLEQNGADPQLVAMARAGQGGQAYKFFQDQRTAAAKQPAQRQFTTDANKTKRFVDTGEAVFPNVQAGTSPQITLKQRNELGTAEAAIGSLDSELDAYANMVGEMGNEYLPGAGRDALLTKRRSIQMQMKELFNLGVLNGPDLDLMDEMLYNAAPGGAENSGYFDKPAAMIQEGLGSVGLMDTPGERAKANATQLKAQFKQLLTSKKQAYGAGGQPPKDTMGAPNAAQAPAGIDALSDDELNRIANGG